MRQRAWIAVGLIAAGCVMAGPEGADMNPSRNAAAGSSREVAVGYKAPRLVIPYARVKPTADGVIGDAEWQGAASINALQTTTHAVSPRQTRFWLMWDEDNLYVAMRSPLRGKEPVIRKSRDTTGDINVVFDDSYEIWLDVGSKSPDGQPVFFQFLSNFAGARFDVMHEPAVGNMRTGWTAGWTPANRITPDGDAWEMEVAIPRRSLYVEKPFADSTQIRCLLARNYKNPWEQNSVEGTGDFAVRDTYSTLMLSKSAPAIHLIGVADPVKQMFGLDLAAVSAGGGQVKWIFESDGGVRRDGVLELKGGQQVRGGTGLDLDKPGDGKFRIRVTSADGRETYLDWCALRKFGDLKVLEQRNVVEEVSLGVSFNPVADYVRATGDFIEFPQKEKLDRCEFTVVDGAGKAIAKEAFRPDSLAYVRGVIRLKDLPFGEYRVRMRALGAAGSVLLERETTFSKKDHAAFPWWNTKVGNKDKVLKPWTPVSSSQEELRAPAVAALGVWGRKMHIGPAGLPAQIVSRNKGILAAPATLQGELVDGKTVEATGASLQWRNQKDYQWAADVESRLGDIRVNSRVTVEYDGMYKVEMTLTPEKPVEVRNLRMIVPIEASTAEYIYGKGAGIRSGFRMGFVTRDRKGKVWDCLSVDSQPMTVGSFIPYVWIGNTERGLCWFADSDEGWVPSDKVPAIELRHAAAAYDLVFNLIGEPAVLDKPRRIVFAFEASPVKEMHPGWRMDTWWTGDTFLGTKNLVYPDGDGSQIWQSLPFTTNPEECRKLVAQRHNGKIQYWPGGRTYRPNAVPYFEYNTMGAKATEVAYFGEEWKTSGGPLYYGKTLTDYIVFNLDTWCKECGIDGWYLDNVRPVSCGNIDAGRGYRLPDGRIQPTYNMFGMRDFFLRLRAVFEENGKSGKLVNHMTNNMILPWNGAVDICYDGEHNVIYPEMGKDFMDFWSLERMRMDFPGQWGSVVNFMHEYQGKWDRSALQKAFRAYCGMVILHDALPTGNHNGYHRDLTAGRDRFGIDADDVRFIGYWQKDSGLAADGKDVYLAGWRRDDGKGAGKLLVAVVNLGEPTEAAVAIDCRKLGLPAAGECKAWDAETEAAVGIDAAGRIVVPLDRHDYRQIVVESR